ncbi:MAG: Gfo/Idh/MocA family protein [Solirubrobacteraceae bacterium]
MRSGRVDVDGVSGDRGDREVAAIGVGMLGYAFMGKAHANAYRTLPYIAWPPPLRPELVAIAGRDGDAASEAARRYGFASAVTDWRELVRDERIRLFDNVGPNNLHGEPSIAAARAGKHVICEKPLGRDASESYEIWQGVAATGVKHMCAFNYRFVPAVRLARELISAGALGEPRHFRARYLQSWGLDADLMGWRFDRSQAGTGALGDLGAHIIDLARYLVGEPSTVSGITRTFVAQRHGRDVDVDDAFQATVEFEGGATGTLEASRLAPGRLNQLALEINGSRGSLAFDLERLNELQVCTTGSSLPGFQRVLVTEPQHPFMSFWWPPGHIIGYEHTFIHELHHLLQAIARDGQVRPHGADFEDGYRAAVVCDAIARSASTGAREIVRYRH